MLEGLESVLFLLVPVCTGTNAYNSTGHKNWYFGATRCLCGEVTVGFGDSYRMEMW